MEMQIPQLRQLFESRIGQISNVLAKDPPPELGKVDPMMRALKGFLFALEGMLRQNELQHMPFTARVELYDRVDQAIDILRSLPESVNSKQALHVLRVMDGLHRLCLHENLMASGLDASKLGRLTVILERKLGEVLQTIDEVAETGQGRAGQIEQATQERLADIQGTYKREAEALVSSASTAVESIRAQAKTVRQQQTEAVKTVDGLQGELSSKFQQCQSALNEQLSSAGSVVAKIRGEQQAVTDLLARARAQLDSTQATIQTITESAEATESTRDELQAKLSEGRDAIGSMRKLLENGTQAAEELATKVVQAQQGLANIQQTADNGAELSERAAQEQAQSVASIRETAEAVAAARESAGAAEKMLADTRQSLDLQLETAEGVLSEIQSRGTTIDSAVEQTLQQQQAAEQAAGAASNSLGQAREDLTQFRALLAQGRQAAEQLDQLAQAGDDLKARVAQTLGQARQRVGQIEDEASQAATAIREGKDQALSAARDAVEEAERLQRQFAQSLSEQREAVRDAVAGLRSDQAIGADLLARAQQDIETLAGEIARIGELRSVAGDTEAQVRQKLDQANSIVTELNAVLGASSELKSEIDGHLAESTSARACMETLVSETTAAAQDLRRQQDEALGSARGAVEEAERLQRQFAQSLSDQREAARDAVEALRGDQTIGADLLARTQQDVETLAGEITCITELRSDVGDVEAQVRQKLDQAGSVITELNGVLDASSERKLEIDGQLAESTSARARMETLVSETAATAQDLRRQQDEALGSARGAVEEAEQLQRQFAQSLSDQRGAARDAVAALQGDQTIGADLLARAQQDVETLAGEITRITELRSAVGDAEAQVRQKLDQAGSVLTELNAVLGTSGEVKSEIDGHLAESTGARERIEAMLRETAADVEELRRQQDRVLVSVRSETAAAEAQRKTSETALGEQLDAAGALVADLRTRKEKADTLLAEIRQQRDSAKKAGQASGESRVATAKATGEVQASLQEARRAAADIAGLLSTGTESRAKIETELDAASAIQQKLGKCFDRARHQGQEIIAHGEQSQQLITDLRSNGQEALAELKQQNSELTTRGETLQQDLAELIGTAADGGLFHQFDALAQQSVPEQDKWLKRMIVSGAGGGVLLATVSSICALFSGWAAGAVLAAGLVPLGFYMYLCVSQYTAERRAGSEHQYRAAISRSLGAYRKLLSTMQTEGIADSAYVDRMLSALFAAPAQAPPAITAPEPTPEIETEAKVDPDLSMPDIVEIQKPSAAQGQDVEVLTHSDAEENEP
jgi:chromosome segregation ATPase